MIADIITKIIDKQTLTDDERNELLGYFTRLQNAPDQLDGLFSGGTARITAASQITPNLGVMTAGKFITPNDSATSTIPTETGFTGSFMSGNGETFGADTYNIGGVNAGVLQWGASQTDGSLAAGAGAIILNNEGIEIPQPGDAILFKNTVDKAYALISNIGGATSPSILRLMEFLVSTETNQVSNGDFETGDLTSWTKTAGAGGTSSVVAGAGYQDSYGLHLQADLLSGNGDVISQSVTATTIGLVISFRMKMASSAGCYLYVSDNASNSVLVRTASTEWRNYFVVLYGSISTVAFRLSSLTPPAEVYIDDIVVRPLAGSATYPNASYLDMAAGLGRFTGTGFKLISADGKTYLEALMPSTGTRQFSINTGGNDIDTAILGDTDSGLFFVDASTDRVGIGTATPGYKLDVNGDVNVATGSMFKINGTNLPYTSLSSRPTAETNANDIFRCDNPGGPSLWTGTISGAPSGTSVTVSAPVTGTETVLVPTSTSQLAKMRLYNTTRGTSALISNYNIGTNVVTLTATVPAAWANGDSLTIASQTVSGGGMNWIDLEITTSLTGKSNLFGFFAITPGAAGDLLRTHPFETFGAGKVQTVTGQVAGVVCNGFMLVKVASNVFSLTWAGTPTVVLMREMGYLE